METLLNTSKCIVIVLFMWQRDEAVKVLEHFVGIGLKPDLTTYSLLVDAHLVKRDPKAALSVIDEMVIFMPLQGLH